jgi:hypothetical protein
MKDQDLLRCPLLQGIDPMRRAELLGLLNDSNLREKLEQCLAERPVAADSSKQTAAHCVPARQPGDFEKQVHSWNPKLPTWNRSPKE